MPRDTRPTPARGTDQSSQRRTPPGNSPPSKLMSLFGSSSRSSSSSSSSSSQGRQSHSSSSQQASPPRAASSNPSSSSYGSQGYGSRQADSPRGPSSHPSSSSYGRQGYGSQPQQTSMPPAPGYYPSSSKSHYNQQSTGSSTHQGETNRASSGYNARQPQGSVSRAHQPRGVPAQPTSSNSAAPSGGQASDPRAGTSAQQASPAASRSNVIPGLRFLASIPAGRDLPSHYGPDSFTHKFMAAAVAFALDLLECDMSRAAMARYTQRAFSENPIGFPFLKERSGGRSDHDWRPVVQEFLSAIRADFPQVLVHGDRLIKTMNGRTNKENIGDVFRPKAAALIEINIQLVNEARAAYNAYVQNPQQIGELDVFRAMLCRVGITLAHEVIHVYTLFMRRLRSKHTPPRITNAGYGDQEKGEAGRFWEMMIFGGNMDMRKDHRGQPYLGVAVGNTYVWRMSSLFVDNLLGRNFGAILDKREGPLPEWDAPPKELMTRTDKFGWTQSYASVTDEPLPYAELNQLPQSKIELSRGELQHLLGADVQRMASYSTRISDARNFCSGPVVGVA